MFFPIKLYTYTKLNCTKELKKQLHKNCKYKHTMNMIL